MKKRVPLLIILLTMAGFIPMFAQQTVTSFTLVNADTDKPIRTMVAGEVIDYAALGTRNINFVANTNPATVGSVVVSVNGNSRTENVAPYAYAGDNVTSTGVDYKPISPVLAAGTYTLSAVPYSSANKGGTQGKSLSISFSVKGSTTTNQPPVVSSGGNKSLTLPTNSTTLSGTATDADGTIASVQWTKVSGPSATMANASTRTLTLSNLVEGTYVFSFRATDDKGASATDQATVTVSAASSTVQAVTSFTLVNADNNQDIRTLGNGDVINYSTLPTRNLNIRANTNPATVGSVVFSHNGKAKNENIAPYALAGDAISGSTVNYNAISPALAAGTHTLSATPYSSANGGGTRGTALSISFTVTEGTTTNKPPVANAGADKTLTLPTNSVVLNGSGTDSDGTIASYAWTKVSGPSATMSGSSTQNLSLSNLVEGTYVFRLTVKDNAGASAWDEASVFVKAATSGGGGGSCTTFNEQNGLVVMEVEAMPVTSDWSLRTAVGGYTGRGYYEWRHGNTATSTVAAGTGTITYTVKINNPGRYRLQIRSAAPHRTEHNDVWVRFPEGNALGIKGTSTLTLAGNWFKVYQNTGNNSWTWDSKTKDHDPHDIFVDFKTAGTYRVQLSGRSTQFKVDRLVLYRSGVSSTTALSTGTPQSGCATASATIAEGPEVSVLPEQELSSVEVYPNPTAGVMHLEFNTAVSGFTVVELYNISGQLVQRIFEGNTEQGRSYAVSFDASALPDGLYLSRLVAPDKVVTKKITLKK